MEKKTLKKNDIVLTGQKLGVVEEFLPDKKSTFIKVMEYMAFGIPIIATDLPENHVSAGNSAVYFKPGSIEDFVKKTKLLINNKSKRTNMGEIGKKRVIDTIAWEHNIPKLFAAYDNL